MQTISKAIASLAIGAGAGLITAMALDPYRVGKFRLSGLEWALVAFVVALCAVVAAVRFSRGRTVNEEANRFTEAISGDDFF